MTEGWDSPKKNIWRGRCPHIIPNEIMGGHGPPIILPKSSRDHIVYATAPPTEAHFGKVVPTVVCTVVYAIGGTGLLPHPPWLYIHMYMHRQHTHHCAMQHSQHTERESFGFAESMLWKMNSVHMLHRSMLSIRHASLSRLACTTSSCDELYIQLYLQHYMLWLQH